MRARTNLGYPARDMPRPPLAARLPLRSTLIALVLGLFLTTGLSPIGPATPAAAGTAESMEAQFLSLINADRAKLGLVPLRLHSSLVTLSGDRAAALASSGVLSHSTAGCLSCQLTSRKIQYYSYGEVIGGTGWPWGSQAVTSLYNAWKGSSSHWSLLMSKTYNYAGVGVAYRTANKNTYASIVFSESIDQTRPWSKMLSGSVKGDDVTWTWTGADTALQTHTAGLKNFDLQLRIDDGGWAPMAYATTGQILTLRDRAHGHWYGLRVISRDKRGYVSFWTPELRVWVP